MKITRNLKRISALAWPAMVLLGLMLAFSATRTTVAEATGSDPAYDLSWWTVDGGGVSHARGGGYSLNATTGQPDAGRWSGGGYTLSGGFWSGAAASRHVYLPLVTRNWCDKTGTWECEPDDTPAQAHGPIASGTTYYGAMPAGDVNDYFALDLAGTGSVELWLSHIPGGCNYDLVLRDAALDLVGYSGNLGNADEHVLASALPPGTYYVQVYHRSGTGCVEPYQLLAAFP